MNDYQFNYYFEKLKKAYTFEKKKVYDILTKMNPEERERAFSDETVLSHVYKIDDYDFLFMIFRMVSGDIQEKIWSNPKCQKILLGLGNISDKALLEKAELDKFFSETPLEKKDKKGEFYYSKEKVRRFELFLRYVKSERIIGELPANKYYQIIVLCTKKSQEKLLDRVDIDSLFYNTINGEIYPLVNTKLKRKFCSILNTLTPRVLLPHNIKGVFNPTTKVPNSYYTDKDYSLGNMLRSKLWSLKQRKEKLQITREELAMLNVFEISVLLDDDKGVVDQVMLDQHLTEILAKAIKDCSILSEKYIPFKNLHESYPFRVFKVACYEMIGSPNEQKLLDYIFPVLFKEEYSEEEKAQIYLSLKSTLLHITKEDVSRLFSEPDDVKSMFYLKFNTCARRMDYLHGMTLRQLMKLNVKHVNRIVKLLEDKTQDELSDTYSKAIKMYLTFGLEYSVRILSGEYGEVTKTFTDNVSKLNVERVPMKLEGKKYIPEPNADFLHFLFNESNNIKRLFRKDSAIGASWSYLYNNIDSILDVCKGHITAMQAEIILAEQVNNVKYDLTPNNYRLRSILYEVGLSNKTRKSNDEVYKELVRTYEKQVKRVSSSIPYVSGVMPSGYRYETMRLDSLEGYTLGYKASCCIRLLDIAHNHLLHALLCENGRILIVYNPDGTPAAFSPLKRNGDVLIANSVEAIDKKQPPEILEAFSKGIDDIMATTREREEKSYLKVACIGSEAYCKPEGTPWPQSIPTPTILEKNDPIYGNTDQYHRSLTIIKKDDEVDLRKLKFGKIEEKYYDPREQIVSLSFKKDDALDQLEAVRAINAIRYRKWKEGKQEESFYEIKAPYLKYAFFTKDWYVFIDIRNQIQYECIQDDPRAIKEMTATLTTVEEYVKRKDVDSLLLTMKNS